MQVEVAVLADYANMAENGKLNVMGMFDRIWAPQYPATHAFMVLALRLRVEYGDGGPHRVVIELNDEDGRKLAQLDGEVHVPEIAPGQREVVSQVLAFGGLTFPRAGEYIFTMTWDGQEKSRLPLTLALSPTPPPVS